jgi:hypothetical protein
VFLLDKLSDVIYNNVSSDTFARSKPLARTGKRPARTFTFQVENLDGTPVEGCDDEYNRDTGYSALYRGKLVGTADAKYDAEIIAREARMQALEVTR